MKSSRKKPADQRKKSKNREAPSRSPGPSRRHIWVFRLLLALGVPMVFLVLTELALRFSGFGHPTNFLLPSLRDGQKVLVQNNQFGWRFFGAAMARNPEPICLAQPKPANTVRIIVFGESAALGDPQPRFGLPRMLQAMLELRYPGTHFEVVNAGIVAIDSNVILPIARDCTAAGADIWVIYMGNNEVVGPYGAGTVFGSQVPPLPLIRASLALKTTRIGQLGDTLGSIIHRPPADKTEWGGMEMFLDQQVRASDPRMPAVYDHFSRNLSDIIATGRRSGAGVVVSTVAVNLRDCAPFGSEHRPGLSDADKAKWDQFYQQGIAAQANNQLAEAAKCYQVAAQLDDQVADLRFRQGSCFLALNQTAEASNSFIAARDLDTLRFRCDTRLNRLIRETVSNDGDPGVVLADAEQALAARSPAGLPGDDLFYEHVHLTFDGNYLLARTMASQLEKLLPKNVSDQVPASEPWPSELDCQQRLAWSDRDKQEALLEIASRLNNPPFKDQSNHKARLESLNAALDELMPAAQPTGIKKAQKLCENALVAAPDDPLLREQLAALDQLTGDLTGALTNAERAADLLPASAEDWSQLGVILAKQKKYEEAAADFRHAFQLNPEDVWSMENCAHCLKDLGRQDEAIAVYRHALTVKPRFGPAWLDLGQIDESLGRKAEADECYQRALLNRVDRAPELITLARFCVSKGWREAAATNYDAAIKLNPADGTTFLEAGQNLEALGRQPEAEHCYAEAIKLSPDSIQARFLDGLALGREGKPADAAGQFREAVRIMPDLPQARFNLAMALANAGNYSEALDEFDKVLELDPTNAQALNYVEALRQKLSRK